MKRVNPATKLPNAKPQTREEIIRDRKAAKAVERSKNAQPKQRKHGR